MVNSRKKGHQFELKIRSELKEMGYPDLETTRNSNRKLDGEGVDLQLPHTNLQLKATEQIPAVHKILDSMPDDKRTNCLVWKRNRKDILVILKWNDYKTCLETT